MNGCDNCCKLAGKLAEAEGHLAFADECLREVAWLRKLAGDLAAWDRKWPKTMIHSASRQEECEGELDDLCKRACKLQELTNE